MSQARHDDTSSVVSRTPHHQQHHQPSSGHTILSDSELLFEADLSVCLTKPHAMQSVQTLGVTLEMERNIARTLVISFTDPADAFFLYRTSIPEQDFSRLKTEQEIHVDFGSFPSVIIEMLSGSVVGNAPALVWENGATSAQNVSQDAMNTSVGGSAKRSLYLNVTGDNAIFRIMERANFRDVEFLKLPFLRQGDEPLKKYLAQRFRFFENSFNQVVLERNELDRRLKSEQEDRRIEVDRITSERDQLERRLAVNSSQAEASRSESIAQLKSDHHAEQKAAQERFDSEKAQLINHYERIINDTKGKLTTEEINNKALLNNLQQLQDAHRLTETELRDLKRESSKQRTDLDRLQLENAELTEFKKNAVQEKTRNDLRSVELKERLSHFEKTLESREVELRELRAQYSNQTEYGKRTTGQLEMATKKIEETEASLKKAHYIIGNQLQAVKSEKEKVSSLKERNANLQRVIDEKSMSIERANHEINNAAERANMQEQKISELKKQLEASAQQNEILEKDLKSSHDSLVHLQKNSSVGSRWSSSYLPSHQQQPPMVSATNPMGSSLPPPPSVASPNVYGNFRDGQLGKSFGALHNSTNFNHAPASSYVPGSATPPVSASASFLNTSGAPPRSSSFAQSHSATATGGAPPKAPSVEGTRGGQQESNYFPHA